MASKRSFLLRLPPELWTEVKRWADDDLRSVNGQIEFLLREAVRKRKGQTETDEAQDDMTGGSSHDSET